MPDVLFDPESKQVKPLQDNSGSVQYAPELPQQHVRKCCAIVRDLCVKRGIDVSAVPCIHRIRGRFRFWDLRQGRAGASHKCTLLCSTEWRIATADETDQQHAQWKVERKKAEDDAKQEAAKRMAIEAVATSAMNQAAQPAEESQPVGATEKPDHKAKGK